MLVLSRKESEKIMIGKDIVIQVVALSPGKARIGIEAPKNIEVHREEIYEKIQLEREEMSEAELQQQYFNEQAKS